MLAFARGGVQKKDPSSFVLVTCMHDTPMILWTQHAQSYHSNGTVVTQERKLRALWWVGRGGVYTYDPVLLSRF